MSRAENMLLWRQFKVQRRVIHALMIREVISHFGRSGLGAVWLAIEPLTFALPVLTLWYIVRPPFEHHIPLIEMLWSGYMPVLLFRHVTGRAIKLVSRSAPLMYHRNITPLDIFTATCLVEVVQNVSAAAIMFLIFYLTGVLQAVENMPLLLIGYLYMIWWSASCALIISPLSERSELFGKIWQPITYTYMFYSGFGYLADWLPEKLRWFALLQPSLQGFEMIRAGVLGDKITTHYDMGYDTEVLLVLTLVGLAFFRTSRRHLSQG